VFCQAEAWKAARLATSATAMVPNLLLGTFDLDTLLKSNLNGTKQHVPNLFCPSKKQVSHILWNKLCLCAGIPSLFYLPFLYFLAPQENVMCI
jgi:hypothetical protein